MRILVDRHHADLLYSLQRLFQDRLGVDVYVPVGHEWWDAGYWQFGAVFGDDRLAQQYLIPHDGIYTQVGDGVYRTYDVAHPERAIYGVTLAAARQRDWAFAMPSVQENQEGYARFAREKGARYLCHIGNTGQQVNLSLDPLLINTSEYPVPDGKGVTIHQEIDSGPGGAFAYRAPTERKVVRNFVNAMNRIPGYDDFLDVERRLTEEGWQFTIHGHEGREGNINPVEPMGAAMASAGFGWHNKPVGDGFGHVIHSWAAVGRPLIGHASFYNNKLAAPFWTPETSINLDGTGMGDLMAEMLAIAADPQRHDAMCQAIRATFDRLVDYDAEADAVRSLLSL